MLDGTRKSFRRIGPNMVATFLGTCQPIPHFFLVVRFFRIESFEWGRRRIVIGILIRKSFGKVLWIFFSVLPFIPVRIEFLA